MSKFDRGDRVVVSEKPWYYRILHNSNQVDSNLEIGKTFIVRCTDEDGDVFLEDLGGNLRGGLIAHESCLCLEGETSIINAEFEELEEITDSTYCSCGGPSKFHQFDSFSYHSCTSCGLEKNPQ